MRPRKGWTEARIRAAHLPPHAPQGLVHCIRILHKLGRSHQANGLLTPAEVAQVAATRLEDLLTKQSSNFNGVSWDEETQKWRAAVTFLSRKIYLGLFGINEEEKAARVADRAMLIIYDGFVHNPSG